MRDLLNKPFSRALLFVGALVFVIVLPWWLSLPIVLGLTVYMPLYLEVVFLGFVFDTLYSVRFSFPYTFMTAGTVLLLVVVYIRSRIRT